MCSQVDVPSQLGGPPRWALTGRTKVRPDQKWPPCGRRFVAQTRRAQARADPSDGGTEAARYRSTPSLTDEPTLDKADVVVGPNRGNAPGPINVSSKGE